MKQKVKVIIVSLIIITLIGITISYAITPEEKTKFFEVNSTEISPGDTLEMAINVSNINYNEFEFKLISSIDNEKVYTDEATSESEELNVDIEIDDSEDLSVKIDKVKMNLDKLTLYYKIPDDTQIGTKLELQAQIIVNNEVVEQENNSLEEDNTLVNNEINNISENNTLISNEENVLNENSNDITNNTETAENVDTAILEEKIEITIVEKKDEIVDADKETEQENQEQMNSEEKKQQENKTTNNNTNVSKSSQTKTTTTAVYYGSNNNYLSTLKVKDATLNTTFNKENSTYFVTVENKTKLSITATKEDSDATVCITGADDLEEGENKILISVTAENGSVRYYRIFVTNNITEGE